MNYEQFLRYSEKKPMTSACPKSDKTDDTIIFYFLKIHFKIIVTPAPKPKIVFSGFLTKITHPLFIGHVQLILPDLMALMCAEEPKPVHRANNQRYHRLMQYNSAPESGI